MNGNKSYLRGKGKAIIFLEAQMLINITFNGLKGANKLIEVKLVIFRAQIQNIPKNQEEAIQRYLP